ncbi:MAG: hypothetical protein NW208_16930 [Bryobacter sp.]|nr:hypothetical protein [Bryobacter sp.]
MQKLVAALAPFHPRPRGFPPELPFLWDQATLANSTILTLSTELGMLDLIAEVPGVGTYEEAIAGCVELELFGHLVLTLDLPTLIVAKKATGRPKDLLALPELESLLEATDDP